MSDRHMHDIHVDAPVDKTFAYLEDPAHFVAMMPDANDAVLGDVKRTPEGEVQTFDVRYRAIGGLHLTAQFTRRGFVPNEKIYDHSSMGVDFHYSVEPDDGGTKLTFSWDGTGMMKIIDRTFLRGDTYVEEILPKFKKEIEALQ